jgi:hypothetical protein
MRKYICGLALFSTTIAFFVVSCQKAINRTDMESSKLEHPDKSSEEKKGESLYNLEVVLRGDGNQSGHIRFRQDPDPAKIITLFTKLHNLLPAHEYQLQRAVDPINVVDGNCSSSNWLTLGLGLTPQTILTDDKGNGEQVLWRDVSAVPSGAMFDIHFQVIDATSKSVVLTSNCYQYTVR